MHAGTLFPIFVPDIRISDVRPIGPRIVDLLIAALLEEQLPVDALGRLAPDHVRFAKTASRQVLGVMNEMTVECGWHVDQAGGLWNINADALIATCAGAYTPKTASTGCRSNSCTNGSSAANS